MVSHRKQLHPIGTGVGLEASQSQWKFLFIIKFEFLKLSILCLLRSILFSAHPGLTTLHFEIHEAIVLRDTVM